MGSVVVSLDEPEAQNENVSVNAYPRAGQTQNGVSVNVSLLTELRPRTVYLLCLSPLKGRLRTVYLLMSIPVQDRLRTVYLLMSIPVQDRLRTRNVCWKGTFIPVRWGGDCNLALLHSSAVIGCWHQRGHTQCGPPFSPLWNSFA